MPSEELRAEVARRVSDDLRLWDSPDGIRHRIVDNMTDKIVRAGLGERGEVAREIAREIERQFQAIVQDGARCPRCEGPKHPREVKIPHSDRVLFGCEDCTVVPEGRCRCACGCYAIPRWTPVRVGAPRRCLACLNASEKRVHYLVIREAE